MAGLDADEARAYLTGNAEAEAVCAEVHASFGLQPLFLEIAIPVVGTVYCIKPAHRDTRHS